MSMNNNVSIILFFNSSIKDGEVRLYSDERSPVALHDFIEKNNYVKVAPISWYKSPTSLQ